MSSTEKAGKLPILKANLADPLSDKTREVIEKINKEAQEKAENATPTDLG